MVKAHFVNPPYVVSEASSGNTIVVSADIKNIDTEYSEKVVYMTVWDSESDYVMSRAEAFVAPGETTKFNCFFKMPEGRDLWVDIIAGHYKDGIPDFQDDEVYGAKIENIGEKDDTEEKQTQPLLLPLILLTGINIVMLGIIGTLLKRKKIRKL